VRAAICITEFILLIASQALAQQTNASGGVYSRFAVSIWGGPSGSVIPSPNGKSVIIIQRPRFAGRDGLLAVVVKAYNREFKTQIGSWVNAEAAWSPDSRAFFVTYSDGGSVGTYHVKVVYVTNAGLRIIEPITNERTLLVPSCFGLESPNVGAIKWMRPDSSRLLIAVEVPPHSSCPSMGTFGAFEIALPEGSIVSRYGQIAAKKVFANDLGEGLRDADDACILKPVSCVPPGLTTSKKRAER
jgi:hypothetical protein